MTTLAEFHTELKASLNRGAALDDYLAPFTARAVRWLERNSNFSYMRNFYTMTMDTGATYPRTLQLPHKRVKKIEFFRIDRGDTADTYDYLIQIEPKDQLSYYTGKPVAYWRINEEFLQLDRTPDLDYECQLLWYEYTAFPSSNVGGINDNYEHWLMDYAGDALSAQTLILFATLLRDHSMRQDYREVRDEALRTLLIEQEESDNANTQEDMNYTPMGQY